MFFFFVVSMCFYGNIKKTNTRVRALKCLKRITLDQEKTAEYSLLNSASSKLSVPGSMLMAQVSSNITAEINLTLLHCSPLYNVHGNQCNLCSVK